MLSMWDIIMCIHRNKRIIALFTVIAAVLGMAYANVSQSYTSQIIIKYIGEGSKEGLTELGTEIDPYEINNPTVVERALEQLSLSKGLSSSVRNNIKITPIVPKREESKDENLIEKIKTRSDDEKYFPVYYKITFSASSKQGISYARNMLNAIMDQYILYYSEKYLNNASLADIESDLSVENYDYIEVVDLIETRIDKIAEYISKLNAQTGEFRSSSTGYTFNDLSDRFIYIKNNELPILYGKIVDNKISKNLDYTIKNYVYKSENNRISSVSNHNNAVNAQNLMIVYAQKNINSLWDAPDSRGADQAQQVTEVYTRSHNKATYDNLIEQFENYESSSRISAITADEQIKLADKLANPDVFATQEAIDNVNSNLNSIRNEVSSLLEDSVETISDYNKFISAESIQYISGILVTPTVFETLYILVFMFCGFAFTSIFVISWYLYKNVRKQCIVIQDENSEKSEGKA